MLIKSPEDMHELGKKLAKDHKILLLQGELGSGKTTLAKGFAEGLGIDTKQVQSPTYTYLNIYDNRLLHVDMRRLNEHKDLVEKGILDQINQFDYVIIERPKHTHLLGLPRSTTIDIKKTSPTTREVSII
ncbi:MAG: tRNA (adenosine(37)-N6)-threonylcarbamoyltransferase complex ATPase subunit type 1 TsaE [Candidatus Absconditabacteria bacterium]|nr:tRNA (adenosine(37)-N6)-threonylcarbamoyltransferase complex ATPase subunit type 1 TsaE [Candidatus Absconditabacteria bacterium]